ncbi:hypothetical protein KL906_001359 [Ogataea polymorpha]|nr:hypothetical protein KL936_002127 [Ogataea polymorpha]KAG7910979.1 hypothetical protein KL906_001359 [Ogataea polymorpha]KAG7918475.1 hypothetical protein KL927_001932 [Ogataea polymorpha]
MVSSSLLIVGALAAVALAGPAPENTDSPRNIVAKAHLDRKDTKGIIEFSAKNGTVKVHIDVTGLPEEGGPFYYHIHKAPVPANGNCEATGTHLNPYNAPLDECDSFDDDALCQVGDLSGKHGWINTTCFEATYYDPYLSLNPKNKAYIIGLSVNLHFANMTKITCGTIVKTKGKFRRHEEDSFALDGSTPYIEEYSNSTTNSSSLLRGSNSTNGTLTALESTYCGDAYMSSVGYTGMLGAALGMAAALI